MKISLSIEMIDDAEGIMDRIGLFQHQATHTPRSGFGQSLSSQQSIQNSLGMSQYHIPRLILKTRKKQHYMSTI